MAKKFALITMHPETLESTILEFPIAQADLATVTQRASDVNGIACRILTPNESKGINAIMRRLADSPEKNELLAILSRE